MAANTPISFENLSRPNFDAKLSGGIPQSTDSIALYPIQVKPEKSEGQEQTVVDVILSRDEEIVAPPPQQPVLNFPEGGLRAWMTVFGAFLVQYTCFGYINSFGVYEDYYIRHYLTNYTPSDIGWIGGIQIFLTFLSGVVTGRIFDNGHFTLLVLASLILNAVSLFMLSLTKPNAYYQVFLSHGVALGLATGVSYVASLSIAGHYFYKRRALAVGVISSGSALGAVITPIMLNKFFQGPVGFHNGVRISAAMNAVLLIIALLVMRTRLPPREAKSFPIGQWLKEPAYAWVLISVFFVFFGLFYPVFSVQLNAITHGVDPELAFYSTSILNAASFFGRTIPGLVAPLIGTFNLAAFMVTGAGVIVFCLLAVKDAAGTIAFSIFYGFFSGGAIALTPAAVAHLSKEPAEIGTRMGLFFATGGFIGLFATPITGALLTKEYLWVRPNIFAGVMMVASGACYVIAKYYYSKGKSSFWL